MYPPVVSVAGFENVDRGLFRAVSNLTKGLECCKKQVRLILLRNSVKINLKICVGGLATVLDTLVYCTETFTPCQSDFINGRSEIWSVGDFRNFTLHSAILRKEALIYAH
jgi:hypothetical protein